MCTVHQELSAIPNLLLLPCLLLLVMVVVARTHTQKKKGNRWPTLTNATNLFPFPSFPSRVTLLAPDLRTLKSSIPQRLPLALPFHQRSLLVLVLVTHPPPRPRRALTVDPRAPDLPRHRPRLALLLPCHPLRISRLALPGVLVNLRSFGRRFWLLGLRIRRLLLFLFHVLGRTFGSSVVVESRVFGFMLAGSGGAVTVLFSFEDIFVVAAMALPVVVAVFVVFVIGASLSR